MPNLLSFVTTDKTGLCSTTGLQIIMIMGEKLGGFTNFFADNSTTEGFRSVIDHTASIMLLKGKGLKIKNMF